MNTSSRSSVSAFFGTPNLRDSSSTVTPGCWIAYGSSSRIRRSLRPRRPPFSATGGAQVGGELGAHLSAGDLGFDYLDRISEAERPGNEAFDAGNGHLHLHAAAGPFREVHAGHVLLGPP